MAFQLLRTLFNPTQFKKAQSASVWGGKQYKDQILSQYKEDAQKTKLTLMIGQMGTETAEISQIC